MTPEATVETLGLPFREEPQHRILFHKTQEAMHEAGSSVNSYWEDLIQAGIADALMTAQIKLTSVPIAINAQDVSKYDYFLSYEGAAVDNFLQPLDIFHLVKDEDLNKTESVGIIKIGTYRGLNTRYSQLVMFTVEDEDSQVPEQSFHFFRGELVYATQVTQPQVAFEGIGPEDEKQFAKVRFFVDYESRERTLVFTGGIYYEDFKNQHLYKNESGVFVTTQKLSVTDPFKGEVQFFDVEEDGQIQISEPFSLPDAIRDMGKFQPINQN
ncbi:hypothetical protein HY382_01610 [Candidatus Curtissbacteria bacterium]|nr:hypothetical protein [Candidatus Curtissbacteria bacterium]